jgi:hypothetical protein
MCRSLAIATVLAVLGGTATIAPAATAAAGYVGTTSQNQRFALNVATDGVRFRIDWTANCGDGGKPFAAETASQRALPLRGGRFSSHESYDATANDGAKVHYEIAISGRVRRRHAAGTWQATAFGPYAGGGTYRCNTGRVTWLARRGG